MTAPAPTAARVQTVPELAREYRAAGDVDGLLRLLIATFDTRALALTVVAEEALAEAREITDEPYLRDEGLNAAEREAAIGREYLAMATLLREVLS